MLMFRSDAAADGALGGGGGGASARKGHPIFKVRRAQSGDGGDGGGGSSTWNTFACSISLNDSDPRFRPPICSTLVGFAFTGLGIAALLFRHYPIALWAGVALTSLGVVLLLFSFLWLFMTRQKILRTLALKATGMTDDSFDYKNDRNIPRPYPVDPIMTRGLVTIYYKSCEDTLPYGTEKCISGRKNVRVPPTESFIPVESTCFQLISGKVDNKNSNKNHGIGNGKSGGVESNDERRISNISKGRTLPARPMRDRGSRLHVRSETLDHRMQNAKTPSTESDTLSREHPTVQPTRPEPLSGRSDKWDTERSHRERQPMLSPHMNVYKTDLKPPKRPR